MQRPALARHAACNWGKRRAGCAPPLIANVMRHGKATLSPELETLDQLLGGDMSLSVIKRVFPDEGAFLQGISGLIRGGDVELLDEGEPVAGWRVRELFDDRAVLVELSRFMLRLTEKGARRVS